MTKYIRFAGIVAAMFAAVLFAAPASAQATRTWVSGVGDDANACSRTAPCKTFAGAISKTAAGGEIDCLDPGGFGAITITKAITMDCGGGIGGQAGSILVSGTNGIVVAAGATDRVKIRNMTLDGIGGQGLAGIRFNTGGALIVEHVGIFGFGSGATSGTNGGVDFEPSGASKLSLLDVETEFNLADGVLIKPASGGSAAVSLDRVSALINGGTGVKIDNTSAAAVSNVTMRDSIAEANSADGVAVSNPGTSGVKVALMIDRSAVSNNTYFGVEASGSKTIINLTNSVVTGNATGVTVANGGMINTYKTNEITGNTNDNTSVLTSATQN